jgi:hypothetical protein
VAGRVASVVGAVAAGLVVGMIDATSLWSAVTVPKIVPVIVIFPRLRVTVPLTRSPFLKTTSSARAAPAAASNTNNAIHVLYIASFLIDRFAPMPAADNDLRTGR